MSNFVERTKADADVRFSDPHKIGWASSEIAIQDGRYSDYDLNKVLERNVTDREEGRDDPSGIDFWQVYRCRPAGMS